MPTDEHELYLDEISHEACRVTDCIGIQIGFVGWHAFWVMESVYSMT